MFQVDSDKVMVGNAPYNTIKYRDLTIEGYSRAAVQSYWRVVEMKLGFDLGAQPWEFMGTATWFLTHTHLDHVAALPVYVARRRMMKMTPPVIYTPEHSLSGIQAVLRAFSKLDRGRLPCELIGLKADEEIELTRELAVTTHATRHTVPSLGYVVWERRKKLKPEYAGLSGDEIRDLRMSGEEVSQEVRIPVLGYVGDTSPQGLDDNPIFYEVEVLISELTFVAPDHRVDKIHKNGHMHLDDYVSRKDRFQNQKIILGHFSTRYHPQQIQRMVSKALPDMLDGRLELML